MRAPDLGRTDDRARGAVRRGRAATAMCLACFAVAAVTGCAAADDASLVAAVRRGNAPARIAVDHPLPGTVFPRAIPAPAVRWTDAAADTWIVAVQRPDGTVWLQRTRAPQSRIPDAVWDAVRAGPTGKPVEVTVVGLRADAPGQVQSGGTTTLSFSADPVDGSLFYREVNLPFLEAVKDPSRIRWRFGAIGSKAAPPIVLTGLPVCGNCHSFSADGKTMGMDVDYASDKGSYALADTATEVTLTPDKIITWTDYRRGDGTPTFGLLSQVSPNGRYVVSTVKDRSVFVPRPDLAYSQLFFPVKGILAIYDRVERKFAALPGADDPAYVQSNAHWSPDGRTLVFARARARDLALAHDSALLKPKDIEKFLAAGPFRFDLYTIQFNEGRGGPATPLRGASDNGKSNFFGRYSPDGRFIVFTQAASYMLLQPDSTLWIVPAAGGEPRKLRANTPAMNSWHSWSPNGRWLVFSSKANGPYTQLYLTHVDSDGRDAPAVHLDHLTTPGFAANIPEFVRLPADAIRAIRDGYVDDYALTRAATVSHDVGDAARAEAGYRKALELNPSNFAALQNLGSLLAELNRAAEARPIFEAALRLRPDDALVRANLGTVLETLGRREEALPHLLLARKTRPDDLQLLDVLGRVLSDLGRWAEAAEVLTAASKLAPADADRHLNAAFAWAGARRVDEALAQFRAALQDRPGWPVALEGIRALSAAKATGQ